MNCPNCNKELIMEPGRRPKKYCSDKCRIAHWQKNKPKKGQYVQKERFEKLLEENNVLKKQLEAILADSDNSSVSHEKEDKEPKSSSSERTKPILDDPMPIRRPNEDSIEYGIRKSEWKKRQLNNL
jgi:CRISPR/Cas system CSM-associated protein Csm4 (group 5 of RAMP superfamily)